MVKEKKGQISISHLAYGQVKGEGDIEYEMCDMPPDVAMATQELYETIIWDNTHLITCGGHLISVYLENKEH